ncbi:MAG: HNH endonuclease [Actinobacteria bacterium]|nr:HNH endonuclease [Actinomycetota bacterium]
MSDLGDCWVWPGALLSISGYGAIYLVGPPRQKALAHRVIYEFAHGPIPDGMQIDHLCRNRACVNPAHLEAVTCQTNLLRGDTLAAANLAKDACPAGHPYDAANTYSYKNTRMCRVCRKEASKRSRLGKRT